MLNKLLIPIYILATSLALISLKLGSKTGAPISYIGGKLHSNLTAYSIIGIVLYGFSFMLYTYLISKFDLGFIIPITTAFVYIIIFTASFFVFKEAFTPFKIIGILLILGGIIFLNQGK